MKPFWNFQFNDTPAFIETFDELPLWSASFGLLLLKHVELKPAMTVLDIGSGAGFPLMELAERLGPSSKCYGLDTWTNANERAKTKIKNYGLEHVEVIEGSAAQIPFPDNSVDLIVSNLGINNFDNPAAVFAECRRVLRPGGKLALTTNLDGHWKEFYDVFTALLAAGKRDDLVEQLAGQQSRRGTVESISELFTGNGFAISRQIEERFTMRFLDGTAFLHHHFVQVGWLSSWQGLIPKDEWATMFPRLEQELNAYAAKKGELALAVPMAFIEGEKPR